MARAIPTYQRQVLGTGVQSSPTASSRVSGSSATAAALGGIGDAAGRIGSSLATIEARETEDRAAVAVTNALSEGDVYWQEDYTRRTQEWSPGGPDLRDGIGEDFDKWINENEQKLPTDASRRYFRTHATQMKTRMQTSAFAFQEKTKTDTLNASTDAGVQADENLVYSDPGRFDDVYARRMEPMLARSDLSDADKIKMADGYRRQLSLAVERGQMERDPSGWYQARFGMPGTAAGAAGGGGFNAAVASVLKHEGGYVASDGNSGAPANFGINQRANPDVDVAALTADSATKLYKDRYWDAISGDTLPPGLQGTALDAAVNQGPANARKWIKQSGGDFTRFNALRREHYEELLQKPEYAKFRDSWMARLESYEAGSAIVGTPIEGAPKTFRSIDWEQQSALRSLAETKIKQGDARFKATADAAVRDAVAMHKDGVLEPEALRPSFFIQAYGEQGPEMYAQYEKSREMGADIAGFKTQSQADIMAEVARSRPAPGTGYAADDERYRTVVAAAQQVLQARANDPVGYATANSPELTAQRAALDDQATPADQRPALMQTYVRESIAEQQRLGIASPRVLTPGQADAIATRAMAAARPEDSANLIAGLEAEYGGYFPHVFGELVKDKKIAGELLIIPNLPSQTAREAVSRLARVKETDLVQGIEAADQKVVKEQVTTHLEGFARAVPLMTEQAAGVVNAYETTLRKMAYQFIAGGESAADAVEHAGSMLLGQYAFDGTMRIPTTVDARAMKRGAAGKLASDIAGIDVPQDFSGARSEDEVRAEWEATVKARPLWFTSDDDGGLQLWAQGSNGVRYRVTRGGAPVAYTWEQLKSQDTEMRNEVPQTVDRALEVGDMRAYERLSAEEKRRQRALDNEEIDRMRIQ